MSINTVTLTANIQVQRIVESVAVSPLISAVRITTSSTIDGEKKAWAKTIAPVLVREGFALTADVEAYVAGTLDVLSFDSQLAWVPTAYLDDLRLQGYALAGEKHGAAFDTANKQIFSNATLMPEPYILVRADFGGHMIFDLDGVPHPTGLTYNYIDGHIRDGYLDLTGALVQLKKNPLVGLRTIKHKFEREIQTELVISDVPYYNVSGGCSQQIEFIYQPTAAQMKDIWAEALKLNKQYPTTALRAAVKSLDLLGLAQFEKVSVDSE